MYVVFIRQPCLSRGSSKCNVECSHEAEVYLTSTKAVFPVLEHSLFSDTRERLMSLKSYRKIKKNKRMFLKT